MIAVVPATYLEWSPTCSPEMLVRSPEEAEFRTLFVGELSFFSTEDDIRNLFLQHGAIVYNVTIRRGRTGDHLLYGFVEVSASCADAVMLQLDGLKFMGRRIRVNETVKQGQSPRLTMRSHWIQLHVSFVSDSFDGRVDEEFLDNVFSQCGTVADVTVKQYRRHVTHPYQQGGYAFVYYVDQAGADNALATLRGVTIFGVSLDVNEPRPNLGNPGLRHQQQQQQSKASPSNVSPSFSVDDLTRSSGNGSNKPPPVAVDSAHQQRRLSPPEAAMTLHIPSPAAYNVYHQQHVSPSSRMSPRAPLTNNTQGGYEAMQVPPPPCPIYHALAPALPLYAPALSPVRNTSWLPSGSSVGSMQPMPQYAQQLQQAAPPAMMYHPHHQAMMPVGYFPHMPQQQLLQPPPPLPPVPQQQFVMPMMLPPHLPMHLQPQNLSPYHSPTVSMPPPVMNMQFRPDMMQYPFPTMPAAHVLPPPGQGCFQHRQQAPQLHSSQHHAQQQGQQH